MHSGEISEQRPGTGSDKRCVAGQETCRRQEERGIQYLTILTRIFIHNSMLTLDTKLAGCIYCKLDMAVSTTSCPHHTLLPFSTSDKILVNNFLANVHTAI